MVIAGRGNVKILYDLPTIFQKTKMFKKYAARKQTRVLSNRLVGWNAIERRRPNMERVMYFYVICVYHSEGAKRQGTDVNKWQNVRVTTTAV